MEIINDNKEKLELTYPTLWTYKLIGYEKKAIQSAIEEIVLEREYTLKHSNSSKSGKYISMNFELIVTNEDERNFIYESLKAHQHIKMVL